jgi:hypothetical protein
MNIATQDPNHSALCILPTGERITTAAAKTQGYTIQNAASVGRSVGHKGAALDTFTANYNRAIELGSRTQTQAAYLSAILALPEAKSRPSAAARLGASNTEAKLTVAQAQAFLRGLPEESAPPAPAASMTEDMRVFRRQAAIRISMLTFNASNGNKAAGREATKLSNAMRVFDEGGISLQQALTSAGLDARATIRSVIGL